MSTRLPDLRRIVLAATLIGLGTLACGHAQPESDHPGDRQHTPERPDPAQIREMIRARLEWAHGLVGRLEAGLKRLDEGEQIEPSLWRELARFNGDGVRSRSGDDDGSSDGFRWHDGKKAEMPTPEEMKAFIEERVPWLAERLTQAEEKFPGAYDRTIRGFAPRIAEIMQQSKDDPEAAELFIEQFHLGADIVDEARRVRRAVTAGEMTEDEARAAWRTLAERHFDIRERLTRHEVDQARAHLTELEARITSDNENRAKLIEEMAERMFRRSMFRDRRDDHRDNDAPHDGPPESDRQGPPGG